MRLPESMENQSARACFEAAIHLEAAMLGTCAILRELERGLGDAVHDCEAFQLISSMMQLTHQQMLDIASVYERIAGARHPLLTPF